jgi:hypothetical protein
MVEDHALPNEQQRAWLTEMIYQAFIEIRLLGWDGKSSQCADLADAFHNIPYQISDPRNWSWSGQRRALSHYCEKYKGSRPASFNYVQSLNLIAEGNDPSKFPR